MLDVLARSHDLNFQMDAAALLAHNPADMANLKLAKDCPGFRGVPVSEVLNQVLNLTDAVPLAYVVRNGYVRVVPLAYVLGEMLSWERITLEGDGRRLVDLLREIADRTGATILVDAKRAGAKADTPITTVLQQTPLQDSVKLLADMAGLKAVLIGNAIYVTTEENAAALVKEQAAIPIPAANRTPAR